MKKFSLLLAAAAVVVALAVSGGASAEKQLSPHEVLGEGEILMASFFVGNNRKHFFTVAYGEGIYVCETRFSLRQPGLWCTRASAKKKPSAHKILREGEILMASPREMFSNRHYFTVVYNEMIYVCETKIAFGPGTLWCSRNPDARPVH